MDTTRIDELDGQQVADALVSTHAALVEAEAREYELVAQWAVVHNPDTVNRGEAAGTGRVLPGTERAKAFGAHGTPAVAEFAAAELAVLLGRSVRSAQLLLADVLDLQHRHPALWQGIRQRRVRPWQAVPVARATHRAELTLEQARWVDAQVAGYIGSLPRATFEELVAAKVIEADPAAAEVRRRAAELEQFVATGRHGEHGLKTLIARANAGDVVLFVAMVDRIARILAVEGDDRPVGVRRAAALGILANPARALLLLQRHAAPEDASDAADPAPASAGVCTTADLDLFGDRRPGREEPVADPNAPRPGWLARYGEEPPDDEPRDERWDDRDPQDALEGHPSGRPPDTSEAGGDPPAAPPCPSGGPEPGGGRLRPGDLHPGLDDSGPDAAGHSGSSQVYRHRCPTCAGAGTVPGDPSLFVSPPKLDARKLLPAATLYVHVSQASFAAHTGGVARVEGVGPVTVEQAIDFLGHRQVTVKQVVDLDDLMPVDCYEVPDRMREAVGLLRPRSVFPYSPARSRGLDLDHPQPYVPPEHGGPAGQTDPYALGPLARFEHRVKTHAPGWRLLNPSTSVYLWRTPHGYWYRTDPHGTHRLGKHPDLTADGITAPSVMERRLAALLDA